MITIKESSKSKGYDSLLALYNKEGIGCTFIHKGCYYIIAEAPPDDDYDAVAINLLTGSVICESFFKHGVEQLYLVDLVMYVDTTIKGSQE